MENKDLIIIIIAIVLALLLFSGFGMMTGFFGNYGGYGGYGGMMTGYNYGYGMMTGFFGFGWIIMILVVIALVLFIVWLIKQIGLNEKGERRRK